MVATPTKSTVWTENAELSNAMTFLVDGGYTMGDTGHYVVNNLLSRDGRQIEAGSAMYQVFQMTGGAQELAAKRKFVG